MSVLPSSTSKYGLTSLALQAAIELERLRANTPYDNAVLGALASALVETSDPHSDDAPFRFVEPGYYEPFERLCRLRESSQSVAVEAIQAFIKGASDKLSRVKPGEQDLALELINFCVALHRELIQEISAEDAFVVHEWRNIGGEASTGVGAA